MIELLKPLGLNYSIGDCVILRNYKGIRYSLNDIHGIDIWVLRLPSDRRYIWPGDYFI